MNNSDQRPLTPERPLANSPEGTEKRICELIMKLKRREILGAYAVGRQVAKLFSELIAHSSSRTARELMLLVRRVGNRIQAAQPLEFTIGCMTRRVLTFIREGVVHARKKHTTPATGDESASSGRPRSASQLKLPSVESLSISASSSSAQYHFSDASSLSDLFSSSEVEDFSLVLGHELKDLIATYLDEMLSEMKGSHESIATQAEQHIHTNEVVLTYGRSRTVLDFLKAVRRVRDFEVIVAESAPSRWGHRMAKDLADANVSTTLITDSAVFAMMARVNIVIVGTHAVLANGGLVAHSGLHLIALAAKHYSVPLVVCSGLYKLCPLYAFDQDTFQEHNSPTPVLPFTEADDPNGQVEVLNPSYDYIPPELVSLFVTNDGTYAPSYIYRQLAEFYHRDDYDLEDDSLFA